MAYSGAADCAECGKSSTDRGGWLLKTESGNLKHFQCFDCSLIYPRKDFARLWNAAMEHAKCKPEAENQEPINQ